MPIPGDMPKLERSSAKERVLRQLTDWITDGTLEPGEKILDGELAHALGVSRTPIREALQILETQGFVEMRPGRETRVTPLSRKDAYQLYPPLASLEATAAELAAERITEAEIGELAAVNDDFFRAVTAGEPKAALDADERFHRRVVGVSGNPYLADFTALLQRHIRRLKVSYFRPTMVPAQTSIEEHRAILQAFRDHDGERAARLMRQNWLRAMPIVARQIPETPQERN